MLKTIYLKSLYKRNFRLTKNLIKTFNSNKYWIYYKILFNFNKNIKYKNYNKNLLKTLLKVIDYQLILK